MVNLYVVVLAVIVVVLLSVSLTRLRSVKTKVLIIWLQAAASGLRPGIYFASSWIAAEACLLERKMHSKTALPHCGHRREVGPPC